MEYNYYNYLSHLYQETKKGTKFVLYDLKKLLGRFKKTTFGEGVETLEKHGLLIRINLSTLLTKYGFSSHNQPDQKLTPELQKFQNVQKLQKLQKLQKFIDIQDITEIDVNKNKMYLNLTTLGKMACIESNEYLPQKIINAIKQNDLLPLNLFNIWHRETGFNPFDFCFQENTQIKVIGRTNRFFLDHLYKIYAESPEKLHIQNLSFQILCFDLFGFYKLDPDNLQEPENFKHIIDNTKDFLRTCDDYQERDINLKKLKELWDSLSKYNSNSVLKHQNDPSKSIPIFSVRKTQFLPFNSAVYIETPLETMLFLELYSPKWTTKNKPVFFIYNNIKISNQRTSPVIENWLGSFDHYWKNSTEIHTTPN